MAESPIAPETLRFIVRYIHSVERLEILCLLAEDEKAEWSDAEVLRHIQSTERSVKQSLEYFVKEGLFAKVDNGFRFAPQSADLAREVKDLAKTYRNCRVAVIEAIYKKPADTIQTFADAFRLRWEK